MPHFQATVAESLNKGGHQLLIELEGEDATETLEQGFGQGTSPRSDLEDPRRFIRQRCSDSLGNGFIDQEVLAEPTSFWPTHPAHPEF
jgi:hypothetical protein